MKKYLVIPALVIIAGLFSFVPADKWITYTSKEGRFSIEFPGKPTESTQDDKTADGKDLKLHFANFAPSDDIIYMASWINMTSFYPANKDIKKILEDSRDGAIGNMKARDVVTTATRLGVTPYIEFSFATDDFVGKDRIYMINKHQYSIITLFKGKTTIPADADKFIGSFKPLK